MCASTKMDKNSGKFITANLSGNPMAVLKTASDANSDRANDKKRRYAKEASDAQGEADARAAALAADNQLVDTSYEPINQSADTINGDLMRRRRSTTLNDPDGTGPQLRTALGA